MEENMPMTAAATEPGARPLVAVRAVACNGAVLDENMSRWTTYVLGHGEGALSRHPGWLAVLAAGLKHEPYCVEASIGGRIVGLLPLAYVKSLLFGKFLVSLPYLNSGGVLADEEQKILGGQ